MSGLGLGRNSDCNKEFSGTATIVLGDNGGCTALENDLHGTYNSKGVFISIATQKITGLLSVSRVTLVVLLLAYSLT